MAIKYRDSMDASRVVEVFEQKGGYSLCRVYWYDRNRNAFDYGGQVSIANVMFGESPWHARVGFVPFSVSSSTSEAA